MSAPDGERPQGAKAIPETGVARVAQRHRCGLGGGAKQDLTGSLQAKPAAGCAAPVSGLFFLLKHTIILAQSIRARAQGGASP
jgi:hypothetical protein